MRRIRGLHRVAFSLAGVSALALGVLASTTTPAAAATAADGCAGAAILSTGSQDVPASAPGQSAVRDVRVGEHRGCDRIVIEFTGPLPGYRVGYVRAIRQDASDKLVPLEGSAFLSIVLRGTLTAANASQPNLRPRFRVLRQVRGAGDFEGVTSYGAGLASRQPFLAYPLQNPSRLVIDIAAAVPPQVTRVPTGGIETGGGSTAGARPLAWSPVELLTLVALATVVGLIARRRIALQRR